MKVTLEVTGLKKADIEQWKEDIEQDFSYMLEGFTIESVPGSATVKILSIEE